VHGAKVVDLWGGIRNTTTAEPWARDTMVIVCSATKGLAAMTLAIAHSRGWLDYDERVCAYWPQFAQHGKERVTVRQLLAHQAGLFALDQPIDRSVVADLDRLAVILARQKPAWEPGTRQAYHAITLGYYENELLRRVDPRHRSLGRSSRTKLRRHLRSLHKAGCVNEARGLIEIRDRRRLEQACCECVGVMREAQRRLLGY
jgi:CubicO group peptidase (beta-lactamase class C family)